MLAAAGATRAAPQAPRELRFCTVERPAPLGWREGLSIPLDDIPAGPSFVTDQDGDGLPDLAYREVEWRMCGNGPGSGRLVIRSGATLAPLRQLDRDGRLTVLHSASAGLAVLRCTQDVEPDRLELSPSASSGEGWALLSDQHPLDSFFSFRFVGDLDRDGAADIALLNAWAVPPDNTRGELFGGLALVSGRDGSRLWERFGEIAGEGYGMDACAAGDLDGDGSEEAAVLVSPIGDELPQARVLILSGRSGQVLSTLTLPERARGTRIHPAGDHDGDGRRDYLVEGFEGYFLLGSASESALPFEPPQPAAWVAPLTGGDGPGLEGLLFGLASPEDGARALWTLSPAGWHWLRDLDPAEPAWDNVTAAAAGALGSPPEPFVVLARPGERWFSTDAPDEDALLLVPLLGP